MAAAWFSTFVLKAFVNRVNRRIDIHREVLALDAAGGDLRITTAGRRACAAEAERLAGFVEVARRRKLLKA